MGKFKIHGVWAKPVFPSNRSLQGSVPTPYIFDDRCQPEDVADAMHHWWNMDLPLRVEYGQAGREFCLAKGLTAKQMGEKIIEMTDLLISRPMTRPRYTFNKVEEKQYENIGIA